MDQRNCDCVYMSRLVSVLSLLHVRAYYFQSLFSASLFSHWFLTSNCQHFSLIGREISLRVSSGRVNIIKADKFC